MTRSIARYATSPEAALSPSPRLGLLDRMFEAQVPKRLAGLTEGVLTIHDASGTRRFGARADDGLVATVRVHDPRFWRALALRGSMGAGEAYMDGWWSTENLTDVIRLFVRNRDALLAMEGGLARLAEPAWKLLHALKRNTITGSQRNIARHYDLSNEFFRLFLDETMTYSSGVFEHADATLTEASLAKIDRLCHKLELKPGDHLLEIGTGWGALAIRAAERFGCRVTSVTISQEQYELAKGRVEEAGLTERVEVRLQDYREILGTFDKVVSVEMIEAVGHQYFDTFFRVVSERLKPDGIAAIQAITIEDRLYKDARDSVDFIKRYIFPGCCIPAVSVLNNSVARSSDLRLADLEDLTPHYARTLRAWHSNLLAQRAGVRELGFDERFVRMWQFYLSYCEGGFSERQLGLVQMVLTKPRYKPAPFTPALNSPREEARPA